ncbi:hypothetical protein QWY31_15970 [Cytophagales bacterium LB-30]|uniref:Uncharacterized protein n=1 Tax=Shiella aurantiaca TaxID=3058365 RepID=A0ABT8F9T2_9BACT|nr:hypothetical protein [Shiella aurantiaca]MDN4167009.1 hypothetical protein [Shiella aurantiaca]
MKTSINLLLLGMLLVASTSCVDWRERDENGDPIDVLPPKTAIGKKNLGFMLDDKVWVAENATTLGFSMDTYIDDNLVVHVRAIKNVSRSYGDIFQTFEIAFRPQADSVYIFNVSSPYTFNHQTDSVSVFWYDAAKGCTDNDIPVQVENLDFTLTHILIDGKIISGEFSMNVLVDGCESFRITDGRFDVLVQ